MTRNVARCLVCSLLPVLVLTLTGCGDAMSRAGWVSLYDGKTLDGWKSRHPNKPNTWQAAGRVELDPADAKRLAITAGQGILVNGPDGRTNDIVTTREFGDIEAHIEFLVPAESNSGVYFMGEYELQVYDSYNETNLKPKDCGGIYPRWINEQNVEGHAPRVNASKPPGKWQMFDVVFRAPRFDVGGRKIENARFVSVRHNGVIIHQNLSLSGPTRGGLTDHEKPRGLIMIQGDHGPVAYRNLKVKPLDATK